tara:strand:+ start:34 stop:192 length:159 start_codon:yes stop_codon:yes gene_type:complete
MKSLYKIVENNEGLFEVQTKEIRYFGIVSYKTREEAESFVESLDKINWKINQ